MKRILGSILAALLFCLASCTDPADPPPSDGISEADRQSALASEAGAVINSSAREFSLNWTDRFTDEVAFGIETLTSGSWHRITNLPPADGVGSSVSWIDTLIEPSRFRIVVEKSAYSLPLHAASGETEFPVAIPETVPQLVLDSELPLTDPVTISLFDSAGIISVEYFVDLDAIASVSEGDGFPWLWDPSTVPNGDHLLSALAFTGKGVYLELQLQIAVDSPDLSVHQSLLGSFGTVILDVTATADIGIESVESFLDDGSLGLLTSPNHETVFRWSIDTTDLPQGQHTIRSVAIDRDGNQRESTITPIFDQPPSLTVISPIAGSFVSGSVNLSGEFSDDAAGVSMTAWLGDVQILTSDESPFSVDYDLSGTMPGDYSFRVRVVDSANHFVEESRSFIVESDDAMTGVLVKTNASVLAVDNGYSLYRSPQGEISLRSPDGGIIQLPDTESIDGAHTWRLCNGRAVTSGQLNGHPNPHEVFLYGVDGQRRNLSQEVESVGYYDTHPVVQWPWVAWSSQWVNSNNGYDGTHDLDVYYLFNLQSDEFFEVTKPGGVGTLGNYGYDLALVPGGCTFYYWAENSTGFDIYSYSTLTGTSTRISENGDNVPVSSDGQRVAWKHADHTFMIGTVEVPENARSITDTGQLFKLEDGVMAWKESDGVSSSIKVDYGLEITLSLYDSSILADVGGGYVAYREAGQLYVWDRENGTRLVSVVGATMLKIDGHSLYVNMPGWTVYVYDLESN